MALINTTTTGLLGTTITGDGSGDLTIQQNGVIVNKITSSGLQYGTGAGPAFSAYLGASQTVSNATWTKVQLSAEVFDTNSNFDSTTNYRFTPTVAGYYQLNLCWGVNATATAIQLAIYKNGSGFLVPAQTAAATSTVSGSVLVYANGSTDYFEFYVFLTVGETHPSSPNCSFQGSMVRSA